MASKTKKMRQAEEVIKQQIVDGHRRGVCNSEGKTMIRNGIPVAKPRFPLSMGKTYVMRNGKMTEK